METTNSNIRKEVSVSPVMVEKVYKSDFQKEGTLTAELRQIVTTKSFYPSKSVSNSLNENIFTVKDFGFEETDYENKETRVAFIDVPLGSTKESVQKQLETLKNATLYRILSNRPIIADTEQYAIDNPEMETTIDTYANRQVVRYPKENERAGELVITEGKVQYRRIAFSKEAKADLDLRNSDPSDVYMSAEVKAEVNGTVHVDEKQTL